LFILDSTYIKNHPKHVEYFISFSQVLKEYMGITELPNSSELWEIYGKICVNSFTILDSDMNGIGIAIYLAPSVIDHSCKPNAVAIFESTTILIRAVEDISCLDWSQVHKYFQIYLNNIDLR
jgi:SET and MYND domain-containing protein